MKSHINIKLQCLPEKILESLPRSVGMIIHLSGGLETGLTIGIGPKTKEAQGGKRVVPLTILPNRGRTTRIPSRRGQQTPLSVRKTDLSSH